MSPVMLPGSEQQMRDVSVDHHRLKTSALLQNQPMIIIKTCFTLQIFLALICLSFVASEIRLWLNNAIRKYLI